MFNKLLHARSKVICIFSVAKIWLRVLTFNSSRLDLIQIFNSDVLAQNFKQWKVIDKVESPREYLERNL